MTTEDLKKIWNNKEKILEGFKNAIIKDEYVENNRWFIIHAIKQ